MPCHWFCWLVPGPPLELRTYPGHRTRCWIVLVFFNLLVWFELIDQSFHQLEFRAVAACW